MKIRITTDRLPNKYPKGETYRVAELTGVLMTLVEQGEAEIVMPPKKEAKKVSPKKVTKKKVK